MQSDETAPEPAPGSPPSEGVLGLVWTYPRSFFTPLAGGVLSVGRGSECSVRLDGPRVSRLHARIVRTGPLHVVVDQSSRNGTWVNGANVSEVMLQEGDVLRIGDGVALVLRIAPQVLAMGELFSTPVPGVLVGPRSRETWQHLVGIAKTGMPVVLQGDTGTGKEMFARAIHELSGRRGEFVALNCAAIPDGLVEAQLFGHTRGAFTGALTAASGVFESAHQGTLLLDEIIELPLQQQPKLLRTIEESAVTRLGEATPRKIDVRLVCASQGSLWAASQAGRFRGDLLARLSGATVELKRLDERREEIPALFVAAYSAAGGEAGKLTGSLIEALCLQKWPLNIRELAQVARQAALPSSQEALLTNESLPGLLGRVRGAAHETQANAAAIPGAPQRIAGADVSDSAATTALGSRRARWLKRNQQHLEALLSALQRTDNNLSAAARSVGISYQRASRLLAARDQLDGKPSV